MIAAINKRQKAMAYSTHWNVSNNQTAQTENNTSIKMPGWLLFCMKFPLNMRFLMPDITPLLSALIF